MPDPITPKPITDDPDEQELLTSMNIPLTDPNAGKDEDETAPEAAAPETQEAPDEPQNQPQGDEPEVVQDTPVADGADGATADTTGGGNGSGAVGGGSDGSGDVPAGDVQEQAAVTPARPAQPAQQPHQAVLAADPIIQHIDSAIEKLKTNELVDDYERDAKLAQLLDQRETRVEKIAHRQSEAENQQWAAAEAHYGLPRTQLEPLNREVRQQLIDQGYRGEALEGAAHFALNQRVAAAKKQTPAAPARQAAQPTPAAPARQAVKPPAQAPTPITNKGARVIPPTATAIPPAPKAKTDEEELVAHQRKYVPGGIRSLVR